MLEFIYPTEAKNGEEWIREMLNGWQQKNTPYFSFAFLNFTPHTVPSNQEFIMYMYYTTKRSNMVHLATNILYRMHVVKCSKTEFTDNNTYTYRFNSGIETIWFKCDKGEEITATDGHILTLKDFSHVHKKKLPSTLRNSIAPVNGPSVRVVKTYQIP